MTGESVNNADDRIVVGYFADGADAYRAIHELIDEGFETAEIGAAFRTPRTGMELAEGGRPRGVSSNPAVSGSVGGAGSHDQAVTPAGLAPGSGNAFPSASRPEPISGSETPSNLPHDLRQELPNMLPTDAEIGRAPGGGVQRREIEVPEGYEDRRERMRQVFREGPEAQGQKRNGNLKFGTGEGHLFPDYEYSEPSFENSFIGMGLGPRDSRSLSGQLSRGGAVVSVSPGSRASLAEGIIERNHGRVRFETGTLRGEPMEGTRVEIYGRMRNYYRPEESIRRKAS